MRTASVAGIREFPDSGSTVIKAIIIQVAIAVMLIVWFKFVLPRMGSGEAAAAAARRETRIEAVFQSLAVEDSSQAVQSPTAPSAGAETPRHLLRTPSIDEVEQD